MSSFAGLVYGKKEKFVLCLLFKQKSKLHKHQLDFALVLVEIAQHF